MKHREKRNATNNNKQQPQRWRKREEKKTTRNNTAQPNIEIKLLMAWLGKRSFWRTALSNQWV